MFKLLKLRWYSRKLHSGNVSECRAGAEALASLGQRAVGPLITALGDGSEHVRHTAAEILGKLGDKRAVEPLIKALSVGSSSAAWALGKLGDSRAVVPLIDALGDDNWQVRRHAAEALGELGKPEWQGIIKGDNSDWMRLASCGDPHVFELLIKALDGKDSDVQEAAAAALGQLGDKRAVEPLIKALGDWHNNVKCTAAEALGKLGDERSVELLITSLGCGHSGARHAAAEALSRLGQCAVEPLIQVLGYAQWWGIREGAARTLGNLGDVRAVGPLRKALGDKDGNVRRAAAEELSRLGDPRWREIVRGEEADWARLGACGDPYAVEPLITALGDGNYTAAEVLGKVGNSRAVEPLIKALGDEKWKVREAAGKALGNLSQHVVEPLIKALCDKNGYISHASAEMLGKLGDERAVEPLIKALGDGKTSAIEALGKLGDARAVEPLIKALDDASASAVRADAAEALGRLGDKRAVEPLIRALSDGGGDCRRVAAEALGKLGDPKWREIIKGDNEDWARLGACSDPHTFDLLIKALGSSSSAVAEVLGKLGDMRAVEPLIKALGDGRNTSAATALGELGDARAIEPLIKVLGYGGYAPGRVAAANALAKLGEPRWQKSVKGDDNDWARLGACGDRRAVEPLVIALGAERMWDVRQAAAKGLATLAAKHPAWLGDRWQDVRMLVTQQHGDVHQSSDCTHVDEGIGLGFPLPPPGLDF